MLINRYFQIFKEKCIIAIKASNEYKIDFWMMNFFDISHLLMRIVFYSVLGIFLVDIIDWKMLDFILFWLVNLLSWKMLWFHNLRSLNRRILMGELNIHILRPVNTYFLTALERCNGNNIISLFYVLFVVYIIGMFNSYVNILFATVVMIFSWFYFMAFFNVLNSISFFVKNGPLITKPLFELESLVFKYTPKVFEDMNVFELFLLLPVSVHGFFVLEILKGRVDLFFQVLPFIILTFILMIIGICILWYYGLKRYEAFG